MNYFTSASINSTQRIRRLAAKLDSKSRLVLPLFVREQLGLGKGDLVLMEIEGCAGFLTMRLSKTKPIEKMRRSSKNGWEE